MYAGVVQIVQTSRVFDVEQLEDIVNTKHQFHIWFFGIHYPAAFGEAHHRVAHAVLRQIRVILVGQRAPEALYAYILAPFQPLYQRYAVEYLAVHVPANVG